MWHEVKLAIILPVADAIVGEKVRREKALDFSG
jgi:hypothetical protein